MSKSDLSLDVLEKNEFLERGSPEVGLAKSALVECEVGSPKSGLPSASEVLKSPFPVDELLKNGLFEVNVPKNGSPETG